jgi:hypothetical protein
MGELAARRLDEKALERAKRAAEAMTLRARGHSMQEIAGELGYSGKAAAEADIRRALLETMQQPADELRAMEYNRTMLVIRGAWDLISEPQPLVDKTGHPVTLIGEDGSEYAVPDQAVIDRHHQTILKASESLRKLMGLDAPTRSVSARAAISLQELQQMSADLGIPAEEIYLNGRDGDGEDPAG